MAVHDAARKGERFDQLVRQYHITHAQAGVEGLAEGAQIDCSLVLVQTLDAGGRQAVVVKFAVVVVLDNPLSTLGRPVDQFEAPLQM
ncbi:hypothetical protein D3C84_987680 [compost metagenome]